MEKSNDVVSLRKVVPQKQGQKVSVKVKLLQAAHVKVKLSNEEIKVIKRFERTMKELKVLQAKYERYMRSPLKGKECKEENR